MEIIEHTAGRVAGPGLYRMVRVRVSQSTWTIESRSGHRTQA
jgi:hypothetical protein